jgi:plastocyanin
VACLLPFLGTACTMAVHASVRDQAGRPLPDAVVYATASARRPTLFRSTPAATMVVENFAFRPPVLPVQSGTGVSFVNRDNIKHQIYSISPAKNFEVPADRRSSSPVVVFERPGVVVLGCALHDRMIGHLCVLETPYFGSTGEDGRATIAGLPRGPYVVRVWHPDLKGSTEATARRVDDSPTHEADVAFAVTVKPERLPEPIPFPDATPTHRGR